MDPTKSYNTLEWRMWPGLSNVDLIKRIAQFSINCTESFPSQEFVEEWSKETVELIKEENARKA